MWFIWNDAYQDQANEKFEDFCFSENDTIGTIIHTEYR